VGDQTVVFARIENLENSQFGCPALVPVAASDQLVFGTELWTNVQAFASVAANTQ